MTALFVDTNVLLHYKTFDEIAWIEIAGGEYFLQIAPIVLDELDKHKNNQNTRTAQRARMIAGKFEQIIDDEKGKTNIRFIVDRPTLSHFESHHLDPKQQDDCLLASILKYRSENPLNEIKLVTADLGVKLKAKTLNIVTHKPASDLRLPDVADKSQKEVERLQKQLTELKERIPKVKLVFENRSDHFKKDIQKNVKTLEAFKATELAKIKLSHPIMELAKEPTDSTSIYDKLSLLTGVLGLSNERRQKYNQELEEYYLKYERYLATLYVHGLKVLKSFKLTFLLVNEGSAPATDIDVWLHLPDGFTVSRKQPDAPNEPRPPYRPKGTYDYEPMNIGLAGLMPDINRIGQLPDVNFDKPTIQKTNSYEVTYHSANLKHGMQRQLDPVILQYDSFDEMKNFTVDYRLNIGNVPVPAIGQLHVVIAESE